MAGRMDIIKQGLTGAVERAPRSYPILEESTHHDGEWTHTCGTVLLGARVHHPIHDGPFPLSGSGQVHIETVPYCPTCEEAPSPHGRPIS